MSKIFARLFYYGVPTILIAYPIASFMWVSFLHNDGGNIVGPVSFENYARIWTDPLYLPLLFRSIMMSLGVAAISVVTAYALAFWAVSLRPNAKYVVLLFLAPLLMSYIIKIYSVRGLLGNNGFINRALLTAGIVDGPINTFTFNSNAVFLTLVILLIPFAFLPIFLALDGMDERLIHAASDLGAGNGYTFLHVVLPLSLPSVVLAASFVFVLAMGDFVTPEMVGGPSGFTFGRVIYSQFGLAYNWPFGSALSVLLIVVVATALFLGAYLAKIRGTQG